MYINKLGLLQISKLEDERRLKNPESAFKKGIANSEMCTFLVMNISSLQLIPVTIIAYRSRYGSASPTAVAGPAIIATMISTLAGLIFCLIASRRDRQKYHAGILRQSNLSGKNRA